MSADVFTSASSRSTRSSGTAPTRLLRASRRRPTGSCSTSTSPRTRSPRARRQCSTTATQSSAPAPSRQSSAERAAALRSRGFRCDRRADSARRRPRRVVGCRRHRPEAGRPWRGGDRVGSRTLRVDPLQRLPSRSATARLRRLLHPRRLGRVGTGNGSPRAGALGRHRRRRREVPRRARRRSAPGRDHRETNRPLGCRRSRCVGRATGDRLRRSRAHQPSCCRPETDRGSEPGDPR